MLKRASLITVDEINFNKILRTLKAIENNCRESDDDAGSGRAERCFRKIFYGCNRRHKRIIEVPTRALEAAGKFIRRREAKQ